MGNICDSKSNDPTVYKKGHRPISSTISNAFPHADEFQTEKINEIKEFLTLTSQNTESFFDVDNSNSNLHKNDAPLQQKCISDFSIVRGLGKGAFGQVYMVRDKSKSN